MNIKVMIVPKDITQSIGMSLTSEEVTIYAHSRKEAMKAYSKAERLFCEWYGKRTLEQAGATLPATSAFIERSLQYGQSLWR